MAKPKASYQNIDSANRKIDQMNGYFAAMDGKLSRIKQMTENVLRNVEHNSMDAALWGVDRWRNAFSDIKVIIEEPDDGQ